MQTTSRRAMALAFGPALITFLLVQACGSGDDAVAQSTPAPDTLVGLWDSAITARNCTTGAALGNFRGMNLVHAGSTVSDTNSAPTATRGPGFGTWERRGAGPEYTVKFQFYRYKADGAFDGSRRVVRTLSVSADGNTANANTTFRDFDPAGVEIGSGCATDVSTRASF